MLTLSGATAETQNGHPLSWIGQKLVRPECVLVTAAGDTYTADWRGGVAHILASGEQRLYLPSDQQNPPLKPNGIALLNDGSFLIAHLGAETGGIFALTRQGVCTPWLLDVDGLVLPPTN